LFFTAVCTTCIVGFTFVNLLEFKVAESCLKEDEGTPDTPSLSTLGAEAAGTAEDETDAMDPAKLEVLEMLAHIPVYLHVYHAFAYAYMGGILGSCSVLFGKTVAEMLKGIFREQSDWSAWGTYQFYMFLIAMLITLLFQMKFLNAGLKYHDTLIVVPIYQTWWILGGIIGGGTYFKEFASMEGLNIVLFVVGVLITLLGVYILTFSRRKVEEDKLPTEGTTVHLDGDGCGDDTKTTPNALGPITVNDLPGNGGNVPKEPSPIRKVPSGSQI